MHFSYSNDANGSKATKFFLVAGLHLAVGALFVHGLSTRHISLASLPEQVLVVLEPERTPPAPPPEPPQPTQQRAMPDIVIPTPEVPVIEQPAPTVTAVPEAEAQPQPATPARVAPELPPATPANASANTGQMRTAVFADAQACALPDYPLSAVRNGETGITTLALLVGTDGRVSAARVQQSSGSRILDRAALNALSLCKFKPATSNGAPEAGWAQMAYVWKLD